METEQYFKAPAEKQDIKRIEDSHKYYREHAVQYGFLILAFIFSIATLVQLKNVYWKLLIIFFISIFYLIFGIWHHLEENNLKSHHVLEYLLVAAIAFVILFSIFVK